MKIVSISQDFFDLVDGDRELMLKRDRPCIVVVRLRFRGKRRDFAVPLRSNIAPNVPKTNTLHCHPAPRRAPAQSRAMRNRFTFLNAARPKCSRNRP